MATQLIFNTGDMTGVTGIHVPDSATIFNSGTISGTDYGIYAQESGPVTIVNTGEIAGGIEAIFGFGDSNFIITNYGRIAGSITLHGASLYDGRSGSVTGIVRFGIGNDTAYGGAASETFYGDEGNDYLSGGKGDDVFDGGYLGADTMDGGEGFDTVIFNSIGDASRAFYVNMANPADPNNSFRADTYIGIEALVGNGGANTFIGNADDNTFTGGKGNDTLDGGGGVNTAVFSGRASDYTVTRTGGTVTVKDNRTGQDGEDTLTNIRFAKFSDKTVALINTAPANVSLSNAVVAENAPAYTVVGRLSATDADGDAVSFSLAANPDGAFAIADGHLVLARPLDFETKAQYAVSVKATDAYGMETVQSFTVTATDVAEHLVLRGTSGANALVGGSGNDTLYGGSGKDVLTGGVGKDVFVFDTRPNKKTNLDTITDYNVADDTIWLDNKYLKKLGKGSASKPGKLNKKFFKVSDKAKDGNDYLVYDKKKGILYYDADGSGAAKQVEIAKLSKNLKLTANDFFVI